MGNACCTEVLSWLCVFPLPSRNLDFLHIFTTFDGSYGTGTFFFYSLLFGSCIVASNLCYIHLFYLPNIYVHMYGFVYVCMFCCFEECFELIRICIHGSVIIRKWSVMDCLTT